MRQCGCGPEGLHVPRRQGDGVAVFLPLQRVHVQPQGLADLLGTAVPGDALKLYAGGLRRGSRLPGAAAQPRQQAEAQRDGGDRKNSPRFQAGSKSGTTTSKPNQVHHYATNKNKTYTPQFEEIANKYGLNLDSEWNKDLLPHQGRHPNVYHDYVLDSMKQFDEIAQGNRDVFLKLYENMKRNVQANPDMLYKNYWNR